ncbi:hypothetical protein [Lacibacter sp.]|uniref:hypothetical protein n=1 Tax=Lacibacter sp. TaxID=1915409 RepID=UPI002B4AE44A|nr:hypothetical protein [Lacibacter sp.]HLP37001.1 hypothetical protein [Lacibacter sp.]
MKKAFTISLIIPVLLSCSNLKTDSTLAFIPGTYVRSELREFGRIEDTIIIKLQNPTANSFLIEQRWRYERVLDGIAQEPEYKNIADQGIYDTEKKLLQNQRNLRVYSFDEVKQVLYNGTMIFQKIK